MLPIYKCKDCGYSFEKPDVKLVWDSVDGNHLMSGYEEECTCPHCGSDDYESAYQCKDCGEVFFEDDVYDGYCRECLKDKANFDTVLSFARQSDVLDELINDLLDKDEQTEILLTALKEAMESHITKMRLLDKLKSFVDSDIQCFADFIEKKEH